MAEDRIDTATRSRQTAFTDDAPKNGGVASGNASLGAAEDRWRDRLARAKVEPAQSASGIELDLLYTPRSISHLNLLADIGLPGEYPFTRGLQPTMYRNRLWTMRQYSGFGTPKESNQRYKWLLEQGQTGISVALDLPTQLGLDSDDPSALDDVGLPWLRARADDMICKTWDFL